MKLIIQPEDGPEPVLAAIDGAKKSLDIVVFRLDIKEIVAALHRAVGRGVAVRAQIAHTNKGGEKALRKLECRLLDAGATVSRSPDILVRYHGKMMIVDGRTLHVNGFNLTWADLSHSRSFAAVMTSAPLVKEALRLFEADLGRQPYTNANARLVVSPETSRAALGAFIAGARKQLLIYDPNISDKRMLRLLEERAKAGVDVRILGKRSRRGLNLHKFPGKRLHVRAILRDGRRAFIGSQSLRALELDDRREIGVMIDEAAAVKKLVTVFEADWALTVAPEPVAEVSEPAPSPENDVV